MRRVAIALAIAAFSGVAHAEDVQEPPTDPKPTAPAPGRPAEKGTIGVGIVIGEPTGLSAKLYLTDDTAIQAAVGSAFIGGGLQVSADYLLHPWILQDRDSFVMPVYLGPGVR